MSIAMRVCWTQWLFIGVLAVLFLSSLLSGCGKTGPLYLPDEQTATSEESSQQPPSSE